MPASGRRHEMALGEPEYSSLVTAHSYPYAVQSLYAWPAAYQRGYHGCGGGGPLGNDNPATVAPDWDDGAREMICSKEGGQGAQYPMPEVRIYQQVTYHRYIRPKDRTDSFSGWSAAGGWNWYANAVGNDGGKLVGFPHPPPDPPDGFTGTLASFGWCIGRPQMIRAATTRTSGLQHQEVRGGMIWREGGTDLCQGGSGTNCYEAGIPTWQDYDAILTAGESVNDYPTWPQDPGAGHWSQGLVLSDVDWSGYYVDPDAGYYTGWECIGGWAGGYPTLYYLERKYPGRSHPGTFGDLDGGFQRQMRLLRIDLDIEPYALPDGTGPVSSYSFDTTNYDDAKRCTWWVMPHLYMFPSAGIPVATNPDHQWPVGYLDSIELRVEHASMEYVGGRTFGTLLAKGVRESNTGSISHSAQPYVWEGDAGDLPSMGTYSYTETSGRWPTAPATGMGLRGPFPRRGRVRNSHEYGITYLPCAQRFWPQVASSLTLPSGASAKHWPARTLYPPQDYGSQGPAEMQPAPLWQGVPGSGPEAFIPSQSAWSSNEWLVDDCTIDGIECEIVTTTPTLSLDYELIPA